MRGQFMRRRAMMNAAMPGPGPGMMPMRRRRRGRRLIPFLIVLGILALIAWKMMGQG